MKRRKRRGEQEAEDHQLDRELNELICRVLDEGPLCFLIIPVSWAKKVDELRKRREREAETN
jgi:hypothetical protein